MSAIFYDCCAVAVKSEQARRTLTVSKVVCARKAKIKITASRRTLYSQLCHHRHSPRITFRARRAGRTRRGSRPYRPKRVAAAASGYRRCRAVATTAALLLSRLALLAAASTTGGCRRLLLLLLLLLLPIPTAMLHRPCPASGLWLSEGRSKVLLDYQAVRAARCHQELSHLQPYC